jgi:hypothetical protein
MWRRFETSKSELWPLLFLDNLKENLRKFFISNPMESYKG